MKKSTILLVTLAFLLSNICFSQSGWFWQNPLPQGNNLNSIKFVNSNTGFTVGNLGTIIKTTNSGLNWNVVFFSNSNRINSIYSFDSINIFVCGDTGFIAKTSNTGLNWVIIPSGINLNFNKVLFLNNNTGFIAGNSGVLLKSTNQGINWVTIQSGTTHDLYTIYFRNSYTGYLSGSNVFEITTDGGNSWIPNNLSPGINFRDLTFINDNTGFAAGNKQIPYANGIICTTTNGGINWNISYGSSSPDCFSLIFLDLNTGFVASAYGIISTTNSGLNWSWSYFTSISYFTAVCRINSDIYSTGWGGSVIKSTNSGINWVNQTNHFTGFTNSHVYFVNSNVGYVCGSNPGDSLIIKTTNGGGIWFSLIGPSRLYFSSFFTSKDTGYLVDGTSNIIKTTNGGINWLIIQTGSNYGFRKVYFISSNTGFAGGYEGTIYKTTNGGNSWFSAASMGGTIYEISFPSPNIGYATAALYGIIKTTDTGDSWFYLPGIPNIYNIRRVCFVDVNTGFVIASPTTGGKSVILKTTNSGLNWQNKFTSLVYSINDIKVMQSGIGYSVCEAGKILKTFNFGENWYYLNSITDNTLWSILVLNDSICVTVGDNKTILKTTNGGGSFIGIISQNSKVPINFSLSQNYPNPFNPVTRIKFDLPKSSNVKLVIFDLLGREMETLLDENKKPGSYGVNWDGSRYASGVYFYKLVTDEYVQTKKMVLLK